MSLKGKRGTGKGAYGTFTAPWGGVWPTHIAITGISGSHVEEAKTSGKSPSINDERVRGGQASDCDETQTEKETTTGRMRVTTRQEGLGTVGGK